MDTKEEDEIYTELVDFDFTSKKKKRNSKEIQK